MRPCVSCLFFFFNDTATTEIYTLSLHDALPICPRAARLDRRHPSEAEVASDMAIRNPQDLKARLGRGQRLLRSEEHTSELQSRQYLVCRLLLEKKKDENSCPCR